MSDTTIEFDGRRVSIGDELHIAYRHHNVGMTTQRDVVVEKVWSGTSERYEAHGAYFTGRDLKSGRSRDFAFTNVLDWDAPRTPAPKDEGRFWIVWNPAHPTAPTLKHRKKVSAEFAARKLARRHPDQADSIYVMQVTSAWSMKGDKPKARHF